MSNEYSIALADAPGGTYKRTQVLPALSSPRTNDRNMVFTLLINTVVNITHDSYAPLWIVMVVDVLSWQVVWEVFAHEPEVVPAPGGEYVMYYTANPRSEHGTFLRGKQIFVVFCPLSL